MTAPSLPDGVRTAAAEILLRAARRPLVMLAPTRGRPEAAAELIGAFVGTVGLGTPAASLVLAVDDDDPELEGYLRLGYPWTIVGPRLRLGPTLNALAPLAVSVGAEAVGFLGDDHRPRTLDWDSALVAALRRMGVGVAYADDGFQHDRIPTAVAISADLIDALGWMVPPGMIHLYLDDWWATLGRELGRLAYLPEVLIEHMHPAAGKGEWDDAYHEVNSPQMYAHDGARFQEFLAEEWPTLRTRLHTRLDGMAPRSTP